MEMLKPNNIHGIISAYFSKLNDNYNSDYVEELEELNKFGVSSRSDLENLLQKHIKEVMQRDKDASILCKQEKIWLIDDMGEDEVQSRIDGGFWFSYPALLRLVLEIEFGESYIEFSNKRDQIV